MLTIGEVAKKTGVSIRSLRHYDEMGLLTPADHSDAGYRLYNKTDLMRLQHIVSLKQLGFSLKKIQDLLKNDDLSLEQTLAVQLQVLHDQLVHQRLAHKKVKQLHSMITQNNDISLTTLLITLESITMLEKYNTKEQVDQLNNRFKTEADSQAYADGWTAVFAGLAELLQKGIKPSDPKTKPLIDQALALFKTYSGNDPKIEKNLTIMYQEEGGPDMLRSYGLDASDELCNYYEQAWWAHLGDSKNSKQ